MSEEPIEGPAEESDEKPAEESTGESPAESTEGPDDDAYSAPESYLYERAIDALIAFLARYVRTALLLARRPSRAVEQILTDLDAEHPRLMRPLGFMAISYLLLVFTMWKALEIEIASDAIEPVEHFLGGFGDVDTLQSLLVAPLPGVVVVVLVSNALSRRVRAASQRDRARIAAMLQYAVGLGLFSLCMVLVLVRGLTRSFDWLVAMDEAGWLGDSAPKDDVFQLVLMGYAVMIPVMLLFPLVISVLPVSRTIQRIEVLSELSWFRKARFCLMGPLMLALTITVLGGLAWVGGQLMPPPLAIDVHDSELSADGATAVLAVSVLGEDPVVVEAWSGVWKAEDDTDFRCKHLGDDGTKLDEEALVHDPPAEPVPPDVEVLLGEARLEGEQLLMLPGTTSWLRVSALDPGAEVRSDVVVTWCYRVDGDVAGWRPVTTQHYDDELVPEIEY